MIDIVTKEYVLSTPDIYLKGLLMNVISKLCILASSVTAIINPHVVFAQKSFDVSNVYCNGLWVREGVDKFQLIKSCGVPLYSDVISGDNDSRNERLLYEIKNKSYAIEILSGKVVGIQYLSD